MDARDAATVLTRRQVTEQRAIFARMPGITDSSASTRTHDGGDHASTRP